MAMHSRWPSIARITTLVREGAIPDPADDVAAHVRLFDDVQSEYVFSLLLSHGLCEALINSTIAVALVRIGSPELFSLCERADFLEKWTNAPKIACPAYNLDKSSAIYETLKRLNAQRNYYLHNKAEVSVDGQLVFTGTRTKHKSIQSDVDWIHRYASLPHDLAEILLRHEHLRLPAIVLADRDPIPKAPQHKP